MKPVGGRRFWALSPLSRVPFGVFVRKWLLSKTFSRQRCSPWWACRKRGTEDPGSLLAKVLLKKSPLRKRRESAFFLLLLVLVSACPSVLVSVSLRVREELRSMQTAPKYLALRNLRSLQNPCSHESETFGGWWLVGGGRESIAKGAHENGLFLDFGTAQLGG